ncbi:glycoside hydrolase family 30 beta sandwich domain-containing protein [Marinimicrobium locisalis]|uniref:glycoside hydrolase family 30 beta sandwich domain-containing protein n=1 Tax=Marinimicrobium locisalis TaxID=546022 RepID=UPI0032222184
MWAVVTESLTDNEVKSLVGMGERELGFSLLRTIVDPNPDDWPRAAGNLALAKAYSKDVRILASPWTPPAHMKSNNSLNNGGRLLPDYYGAYADHLNAYIAYMLEQGVEIDVMSVQNEPDYAPSYQSAEWSGDELRDFVRQYGGEIQAELLIAESLRFNRDYTDPSLNDPEALANVDYVGGHLYDAENSGNFSPYELAEEKNVPRWMTEWNYHRADGDGAAIWGGSNEAVWDETLDVVLASVHQSMEVNWSAYIWWWSLRFYSFLGDGDSQYGTERGQILKRGWAFSHYSKFVRPGYQRIGVNLEGLDAVEVTAYESGTGEWVVVILNRSDNDYANIDVEMPMSVGSAEAYITSRFEDRATLSVTVEGGEVSVPALSARSVATLVMTN